MDHDNGKPRNLAQVQMKTYGEEIYRHQRHVADRLLQINNTYLTELQPLVILVEPCVTILIGVQKC